MELARWCRTNTRETVARLQCSEALDTVLASRSLTLALLLWCSCTVDSFGITHTLFFSFCIFLFLLLWRIAILPCFCFSHFSRLLHCYTHARYHLSGSSTRSFATKMSHSRKMRSPKGRKDCKEESELYLRRIHTLAKYVGCLGGRCRRVDDVRRVAELVSC